MSRHGIQAEGDDDRHTLEQARARIASQLAGYAPRRAPARPRTAHVAGVHSAANGGYLASKAVQPIEGGSSDQTHGSLYLDFDRNKDDTTNPQGRHFDGLRSQLLRLQRAQGFFQDVTADGELLENLVDTMFPEDTQQSYFICNLTFDEYPYLSIRPQIIGPRLERLIPRGMSLAICGRLRDNRKDPDNPLFQVQQIRDISHSQARPFERALNAFVYTNQSRLNPPYRRQNNVLDSTFIEQLPVISRETQTRLQDWHAYLDWMERLLQRDSSGFATCASRSRTMGGCVFSPSSNLRISSTGYSTSSEIASLVPTGWATPGIDGISNTTANGVSLARNWGILPGTNPCGVLPRDISAVRPGLPPITPTSTSAFRMTHTECLRSCSRVSCTAR